MMAKKKFMVLGVIFVLLVSAAQGWCGPNDINFDSKWFSHLSASQKSLLREYFAQTDLLEDFYRNIKIGATEEVYATISDGNQKQDNSTSATLQNKTEYTYFANGFKYYRLDVTTINVANKQKTMQFYRGIMTPEGGYLLEKNPNGEFFVSAHGKQMDDYLAKIDSYVFMCAPYMYKNILAKDTILNQEKRNLPGFTLSLDDVVQSSDNDQEIVSVKMTRYKDSQPRAKITFRFLRNRCWALLDVTNEGLIPYEGECRTTLMLCKYQDKDKDAVKDKSRIPLIREVFLTTIHSSNLKQGLSNDSGFLSRIAAGWKIYTVNSIVPGPVPIDEFDIHRFLPSKIGKPTTYNWFRVSCILLGFGLIVWGLYLRMKSRKEINS